MCVRASVCVNERGGWGGVNRESQAPEGTFSSYFNTVTLLSLSHGRR